MWKVGKGWRLVVLSGERANESVDVTEISTDGEMERGDKPVTGDDAELQTVKAPGVTLKVAWERPQSIEWWIFSIFSGCKTSRGDVFLYRVYMCGVCEWVCVCVLGEQASNFTAQLKRLSLHKTSGALIQMEGFSKSLRLIWLFPLW